MLLPTVLEYSYLLHSSIQSHSQTFTTSILPLFILPPVSFPDRYYLHTTSLHITSSLIPRPLLPPVSFPDLYYLHTISLHITSSLIPRPLLPPVSFPDLYYLQSHSQGSINACFSPHQVKYEAPMINSLGLLSIHPHYLLIRLK